MIDSHCHLDHEPLISDLKNVIQRSKDVGIEKLLTISTSLESFSKIKDIGFVILNDNDVVRHELVKKIINAYESK